MSGIDFGMFTGNANSNDNDGCSGNDDVSPSASNPKVATRSPGKSNLVSESSRVNLLRPISALSLESRELYSYLTDHIRGQNRVISDFVSGLFDAELSEGLPGKKGPKSYYLLMGPSGVGKTYMAKLAEEFMSGTQTAPSSNCLVLNMSSYSDSGSISQLTGVPKSYSGPSAGVLTGFVKDHPKSMIVFDELEKADRQVILLLLQVLDDGILRDDYFDEDISFRDTTILMTTNAGQEIYNDRFRNLADVPVSEIMQALTRQQGTRSYDSKPIFPPEIVTRLAAGRILLFNYLSSTDLVGIIENHLAVLGQHLKQTRGLELTYDPAFPIVLLYGFGNEADARSVAKRTEHFVNGEIYEASRFETGDKSLWEGISRISFELDMKGMASEIRDLLERKTDKKVLLVMDQDKADKVSPKKLSCITAQTADEAIAISRQEDLAMVVVDPYLGLHKTNGISLDDMDSEGMHFLKSEALENAECAVMIYEEEPMKSADWASMERLGAAGRIRPENGKKGLEEAAVRAVQNTRARKFMQRGYQLQYGTAQEFDPEKGTLHIRIYDLKRVQAVAGDARENLVSDAERPTITFDDLIGAESAKKEMRAFIERCFKHPGKSQQKGTQGILLYGPPGTGKTSLARALAGEADVSFFQANASDFFGPYVGLTEENIRKLFKNARQYAPSVIFIDEIDAIGKTRTGGMDSNAAETALNTLLTQMQGFKEDARHPVFVVAATNFGITGKDGRIPLDPALLRRFSNKIYVDLPTKAERLQYLNKRREEDKNTDLSDGILTSIAERTMGESLAILSNVWDLARRRADEADGILRDQLLQDALDEYRHGEDKTSRHDEAYIRSVAIHETGHAYISHLAGDDPSFVTIVSRGDYGGYMQHGDQERVGNYSRNDLIWKIRTSLAGRAAELVFYGQDKAINTGASSDLEQATHYAMEMLGRYGMDDDHLAALAPEMILKSTLAEGFYRKVNDLLQQEMKTTLDLVTEGRDTISRIADVLCEKNSLTGEELKKLWTE